MIERDIPYRSKAMKEVKEGHLILLSPKMMLLSMQFSLWTPLRQMDLNGFIPSLPTLF